MPIDYTKLSLADVRAELVRIADDAGSNFGPLDAQQLHWQPESGRWSAGQCLQHLVTANRLMLQQAARALDGTHPRTLWQRLPVLPQLLGPALIRSQAPTATRKFTAAPAATPASDVPADIVAQFLDQHRAALEQLSALEESTLARAIMVSPFIRVVTYSVLDGWRLIVAHDRRHIEQARRVLAAPGFPAR